MPRVRVVSRNFMEMVAALPAAKLDLLYDRHWTCQAVLRYHLIIHLSLPDSNPSFSSISCSASLLSVNSIEK